MEHLASRRQWPRPDDWNAEWPRVASLPDGDPRRDAMVDRYAVLHAQRCASDRGSVVGRLGRLVDEQERLGRAASPRVAGALELTTGILRRWLPGDDRPLLPITAAPGRPPLRVERSRPGWQLSGAVDGVPWSDGVACAVFALDEGDNEVVAVLDVTSLDRSTCVVEVARVGGRDVAVIGFEGLGLSAYDVVHVPGVRDRLADRLTVLEAADALGAAGWFLEGRGSVAVLDGARSALSMAARSAATSPLVRAHHDVSAAMIVASDVCGRVADDTSLDPDVQVRVERIRDDVRHASWHRRRLVSLI